MSSHRVVLSSVGYRITSTLAGAALVGALVINFTNSRPVTATGPAVHEEHVAVDHRHRGIEHRESHELRARTDMRAYAVRNALFIEAEQEFRALPAWRDQWSLYHVDVRAGGEVVRIYEAVSRIDPDRRFTAMWDAEAGRATEWELVAD